jgi:DNA-binding NarL/FixJ family response regulator
MKAAKSHTILIIEPDAQFREELCNFLLAAGYEQVTATDSMTRVLEPIRHAAYDVIFVAAGALGAGDLQVAQDITAWSPTTKTVLMINAEEQDAWQQRAAHIVGVHFLLKMTFAYNVLYLLAGCA